MRSKSRLATLFIALMIAAGVVMATAQQPASAPATGGAAKAVEWPLPIPLSIRLKFTGPHRDVALPCPRGDRGVCGWRDSSGQEAAGHDKGADGIWTATVGPLRPRSELQLPNPGVDITDPSNPAIKPVPPGFPMSSFVEVPGDTPPFTIRSPYRMAKSGWFFMNRKQWELLAGSGFIRLEL